MKKNINKLIQYFAAVAFLFFFVSDSTAYAAYKGECGENVTFSLTDGVLTLSGSGPVADYPDPTDAPWYYTRMEITSVVVENGITHIGEAAFYSCPDLYSVQLPSSVKTIGPYAFSNCLKLENITLPEKLETIGQRAFERCESIKSIKIPSAVKSVGEGAFYRCESLTSIIVPESVEYLGHAVFAYCKNLTQADIKCNMSSIPVWMFYGCKSLVSATFSADVENVGDYALRGCSKLENLTYGEEQQDVEQVKKDSKSETDAKPVIESVPADRDTTVQETEGAVITTTTPDKNTGSNTTGNDTQDKEEGTQPVPPSDVDIIIENNSGVKDAVEVLEKIPAPAGNDSADTAADTDVTIQLKNNNILKKEILKSVAGKNITLTVTTTQGSKWVFDCRDISEKKAKDWNLSYKTKLKGGLSSTEYNLFGNAKCYELNFEDDFIYDVNLYLPAGAGMARQYAGMCIIDETVDNMGSVIIDDNNMACFAFGAGSTGKGYVFAVGVQNETAAQQAYIPQHMQGEYAGLVDENGTRYVVTGRESRWGIGIGEFTRYVVVALIAVVIVVGSVVYVITKQKQIKEMYKR